MTLPLCAGHVMSSRRDPATRRLIHPEQSILYQFRWDKRPGPPATDHPSAQRRPDTCRGEWLPCDRRNADEANSHETNTAGNAATETWACGGHNPSNLVVTSWPSNPSEGVTPSRTSQRSFGDVFGVGAQILTGATKVGNEGGWIQ